MVPRGARGADKPPRGRSGGLEGSTGMTDFATPDTAITDTFPRQQARTRHFSLGAPRSFQVSADGRRIAFLRSKGGSDPVNCLWVLDLPDGGHPEPGSERLVVDPVTIGPGQDEPEEERARADRSREQAGGVLAFAPYPGFTLPTFALPAPLYTVHLAPVQRVAR